MEEWLEVGGEKLGKKNKRKKKDKVIKSRIVKEECGKVLRKLEVLKGIEWGLGWLLGGIEKMKNGGKLGRKYIIGLVDLREEELWENWDIVKRKSSVEIEEELKVRVLSIEKILKEVIGNENIWIEKDGEEKRIENFMEGRSGKERRGEGVKMRSENKVEEVNKIENIEKLVREENLKEKEVKIVKLKEVVGMKDNVVELEEGKRMIKVEEKIKRIEGENKVERKMKKKIEKELKVIDIEKKIEIVENKRIVR